MLCVTLAKHHSSGPCLSPGPSVHLGTADAWGLRMFPGRACPKPCRILAAPLAFTQQMVVAQPQPRRTAPDPRKPQAGPTLNLPNPAMPVGVSFLFLQLLPFASSWRPGPHGEDQTIFAGKGLSQSTLPRQNGPLSSTAPGPRQRPLLSVQKAA